MTDRKLAVEILNGQYKSVFVLEPDEVDLQVFINKLTNWFGVKNPSCAFSKPGKVDLIKIYKIVNGLE